MTDSETGLNIHAHSSNLHERVQVALIGLPEDQATTAVDQLNAGEISAEDVIALEIAGVVGGTSQACAA